MNKIFLIGNLTNDPETRVTPNGKTVCRFSLAVDRRGKDANGNKVTDFHSIVAFGNLGDVCSKYLAKGRKALVVGELQNSSYEKDGQKRHSTAIIASEVEFLTPAQHQEKMADPLPEYNDYSGELPF